MKSFCSNVIKIRAVLLVLNIDVCVTLPVLRNVGLITFFIRPLFIRNKIYTVIFYTHTFYMVKIYTFNFYTVTKFIRSFFIWSLFLQQQNLYGHFLYGRFLYTHFLFSNTIYTVNWYCETVTKSTLFLGFFCQFYFSAWMLK